MADMTVEIWYGEGKVGGAGVWALSLELSREAAGWCTGQRWGGTTQQLARRSSAGRASVSMRGFPHILLLLLFSSFQPLFERVWVLCWNSSKVCDRFFPSALSFVTFRHKYSASYFPPVNNALLNMDFCPLGEIISMPEGCSLKR